MAIQKDIVLPSGAAGNYLRIDHIEWNRRSRSMFAQVTLFQDAARAAKYPAHPLQVVGLLELTGDKHDLYFGQAAMRAAGNDLQAQLYAAAKAERLRSVNGVELTDLAGAQDV